METKMIATVFGLIILGGVAYGASNFVITDSGGPVPEDVGGGDNSTDAGGGPQPTPADGASEENTTGTNATVNGTANVSATGNETGTGTVLGYVCRVREGDVEVEEIHSRAGPPFDARKAEAMLHERLNGVRNTSGLEPLLCDPGMRSIARNHSELMARENFLGPAPPRGEVNLTERYDGVCGDVRENHGRWLYQRNKRVDWDGVSLDQRVDVVQNHEELVRDIRGRWLSEGGPVFNENATRQGIGMHINRDTRLVHVTQAVCMEEMGNETEGNATGG